MAEVEAPELCPLCVEPLDATDRAIRYCACGYSMCLWCWHQIMETAAKDNAAGRCPNCRAPYEKDKVSMCNVDTEEISGEKRKKKTEKEKRRNPVVPNGKPRKHLQDVRILQRNLVYAVGLSLGICNDETLKRVEYFGQFGRIKKISVNRSSPYSTGQSRNGPTGAAYVTYHMDPDAADCIGSIDGAVWDGRYVRACYGTTKYCAAFLKGVTCNNADCLYMHDIAVSDDTFTKEDMLSGFAGGKPPFYHLIYFDRSKGPVPGSLAIKPPKGPACSAPSTSGSSSKGPDLSPGDAGRGTNALSARSSGEGQDWPELNGRPSSLESVLRDGTLRNRTPRDGTPRDAARRDGTPRDRVSRNGTPRDGTPRDGTPRDGTPRDGTPRNGTPRDGTPRRGEEGGSRLVLPRRGSDGSWTNRSTGTPRSPMQGQSSGQGRQEAAPKKTLAVLSSPLKVKMVTRPPPHTKTPMTPTSSRAAADGGKSLSRPSSRCSDSGGDNTCQGKDTQDRHVDSTMGQPGSSSTGIYSRSPLRNRPSLEAAAPHHYQDQGLATRKSSTPRLSDSRDAGAKGGRRSPCPAELSTGLHQGGSNGRPGGQEDGRKSRGGSRDGTSVSDSLSGTPRSDSLSLTPGREHNLPAGHSDDLSRLPVDEGQAGGASRGLPPGFVKTASLKAVSRRGPPPGFENSFARRNSSQLGATGQTEKDGKVPVVQTDTEQTLQALQGVPALDQMSGTQQMKDVPSLLGASQVLKQNEIDVNVQENRPRQDISLVASMPAAGMPADVPGSLPAGGAPDLAAAHMQSLLLGLSSQPTSPSLLQLDTQQGQQGAIPAHGMHPGLGSPLGEPGTRHLAGLQAPGGLHQPLQPNGLLQQQQMQQQQQQQLQPPLGTATNPLLDLLRQLQLGPTARQKVPADNGFHQHTQATMVSPFNDPAVLAVKKASEKAAVASGSGLPPGMIGGGGNMQGQNFANGALLMYGVMQQQQQQQQQQHQQQLQQQQLHLQQQQQQQLQLHQQLQQQQQQQTILHERQLGLGVRGLQQTPNGLLPGQLPQTPFAVGDNAALLNNGLLGLGGGNQVERQMSWGHMNSQPAQVPQELLGSYMTGNSGLMAHNAAHETMMLGMGATSDPLRLGMVPGMGLSPQLPLQVMEQNNTKFFAPRGARSGAYGPL